MPTIEVQSWKQIVRDRSGKVLVVREVPLPSNVSSVRQEAARFVQYVLQNNGDLKTSVEAELQSVRDLLTDLLKVMESSRDPSEIRRLREPMSRAVALASHLEHMLDAARSVTAGEFTAEALETEAAKMPPSMKEDADTLRKAAEIQRKLGGDRRIRVWEVPSEDLEQR